MSNPKEGEVGGPRKADELAGKDSLADRLRKRRIATESGDASGGQMPDAGELTPGPHDYRGYTRLK